MKGATFVPLTPGSRLLTPAFLVAQAPPPANPSPRSALPKHAPHPGGRPPLRFVRFARNAGKAVAQPLQQLVRPNVFAGENDQADQDEQNPLQHRQKQPHDAQQNEPPAQQQYGYSLDGGTHYTRWYRITGYVTAAPARSLRSRPAPR